MTRFKVHNYYVYILASESSVLYVGVTNNLERRVWEHKNKFNQSFSSKYRCNKLVCFEHFTDVSSAITREKQIKKWRREKKIALIERMNYLWADLGKEWGF